MWSPPGKDRADGANKDLEVEPDASILDAGDPQKMPPVEPGEKIASPRPFPI
jgi:hypothetical protein